MEFTTTGIYIGTFKVKTSMHYKVKISNFYISFKVPILDGGVTIIIFMKEISKVEIDFSSSTPYMCLTLNKSACASVRRKLGMNKKSKFKFNSASKKEEERKIFISIGFLDIELINFMRISMAAIEIRSVPVHEVSKMKFSRLSVQNSIHNIENDMLRLSKDTCWEEQLKNKFNYRKWSSYVLMFNNYTKEKFVTSVDSIKDMDEMASFLYSICWFEEVYRNEVESYISSVRCIDGCGEIAFLKCSSCRVTRYCGEVCQAKHFSKHSEECDELKSKGKISKKLENPQKFYKIDKACDVSYRFFISKIRHKLHCLLRMFLRSTEYKTWIENRFR